MKNKIKTVTCGALALLLAVLALSGCCWSACCSKDPCCTGKKECRCEKCRPCQKDEGHGIRMSSGISGAGASVSVERK